MCESTQTTSASMARNVALPWVVLPLSRLPPLCLLPGHTPAHDARCLAEGNRVSGRERLPFAGSAVTLPPNRAYSFDCTRLSLYVCLEKRFVRKFAFVQQMVAPPT